MTALLDLEDRTQSTASGRDADALIKEARRLRRHRYLIVGLVLLVLIVGTAVGLSVNQGGGHRNTGRGHSPAVPATPKAIAPVSAPRLPGVMLPSSALFTQISVTSKGLLLTGEPKTSSARATRTCVAASVNSKSLAVEKLRVGSCDNPPLLGLTVEAVNTYVPQSNNATLSLVTDVNPTTGRVRHGPVVMTYGSYSDTRPVFAYGSKWLWIYDVATTAGPELLQVSMQTGDVVDTIPMPALYRPLLAADGGGVWVANSIGGSPASALSYVAAGASVPRVVVAATNVPICWVVASGTSAWVGAGIENACAKEAIERFVDGSPDPLFAVPGVRPPTFTVIGDEADGLWTMQWSSPTKEEILHIDPDTGSESVGGTVPSAPLPAYETDQGLVQGQGVSFHGFLYLLEPPFRKNGYLGYSSIVRIRPRLSR